MSIRKIRVMLEEAGGSVSPTFYPGSFLLEAPDGASFYLNRTKTDWELEDARQNVLERRPRISEMIDVVRVLLIYQAGG